MGQNGRIASSSEQAQQRLDTLRRQLQQHYDQPAELSKSPAAMPAVIGACILDVQVQALQTFSYS